VTVTISINILELNLGGTHFESRPNYRLSHLDFRNLFSASRKQNDLEIDQAFQNPYLLFIHIYPNSTYAVSVYEQHCLVAHELITVTSYVNGLFWSIQLEQTISAYVILLVKFIEIGHLKDIKTRCLLKLSYGN